ncbi:MAG: type VI secretion system-associated protein TagF [Burkholderiaceae bacterium]|jgi:type VI secretion system protein ImpM|nr:type VI secretion system-associated protein TagF [Burkholderiaceae bacterium]
MESAHATAPFIKLAWGGKLPCLGDFVWSDGPLTLRAQLDGWLFGGMHHFRLTYGDNWRLGFDHAPLWNFIVPEGAWDQGCVAGCVSPSCDRVGRRFPFIVAYGLPEGLPAEIFSKTINLIPRLLSQTGVLLFDGIRRCWPKETLIPLIEQTLTNWQRTLPWLEPSAEALSNDSAIMDILSSGARGNTAAAATPTLSNDRSLSFPWSDVASHLGVGASNSFWWTNGAGNARLKAFSYNTHPDSALTTWLFGRTPV